MMDEVGRRIAAGLGGFIGAIIVEYVLWYAPVTRVRRFVRWMRRERTEVYIVVFILLWALIALALYLSLPSLRE